MNYTYLNTTQIQTQIPSRLGSAFGAAVAFIFIFFGIIGDTIIIISILSSKKLRNNLVNLFIVSLQLNDMFNIGFNQFFVGLSYAFMKWTGPKIVCDLVVYSSIISTGTLLWHHALIAIHRYLVVVCNQTNSYMGLSPNVYLTISFILARLIPILVCVPSFLSYMIKYSKSSFRCMLAEDKSRFQNLLIVIVNMLIPCLIVLICFIRIYLRVRQASKNLLKNASQARSSSIPSPKMSTTISKKDVHVTLKREYKITKMFAFIFIVFLFGYLPYGFVRMFDTRNNLHPDFYVLLTVLFIISISVSPIVYGLMNTQIRKKAFYLAKLLVTCKKPSKNEQIISKKKQLFDGKNLTRFETHYELSNLVSNRRETIENTLKVIQIE